MAGCRKKPRPAGRYQAWYCDERGRQRYFMAATTRRESLDWAEELEAKARRVRQGVEKPSQPWDRAKLTPIREALDLYLSWGRSQGGRGGRPWAPDHARLKQTRLNWWLDALHLEILSDLAGGDILGRAERALQGLQSGGAAGKTLVHYREALLSFCGWLADRSMIEQNPVERLDTFDKTPRTSRRLLSDAEVDAILAAAPPARALTYRLMLATGLRLGEVRRLRVENLNPAMGAVCLDANQTKNRKPATIFIPPWLLDELTTEATGKAPSDPLMNVPPDLLARFNRDCARAGVVKSNPAGKIDIHGLRVKYISSVVETGATVKEIMDAARHSTPDLSLRVYGRSRHERLKEIGHRVGEMVRPRPDYGTGMHRRAVGEDVEPDTTKEISVLPPSMMQNSEGSNPSLSANFIPQGNAPDLDNPQKHPQKSARQR